MPSTKRKKRKPTSTLLSRRQSSIAIPSDKPLPSKLSRRLIRSHHTTQKRIHQALQQNDTATATALTSTLASTGGLAAYQRASVSGQSSKRGGDSSKVLVDWFLELNLNINVSHNPQSDGSTTANNNTNTNDEHARPRPRLLEIGCLSPSNAIHAFFPRTRRTLMDLNSLHPEILKQDFMTFPVPAGPPALPPTGITSTSNTAAAGEVCEEACEEGYDIISCSLVLNYVPTPAGRGDMLKRIARFAAHNLHRRTLHQQPVDNSNGTSSGNTTNGNGSDSGGNAVFPALFLVLPAPCVTNSRYLTEDHLQRIMASLGYELLRRKLSPKLAYYLWRYVGNGTGGTFKKVELRPGGKRNNFAIVVE
ncbi:hypothetical protein TWF696_006041 [Orbilia brochopaga]|uniref:25S rRNA adenine-N(1) methyltransferase n=1 Tax=Orbilia brochopaga TaxID=3140254 RepID=A0AAV9V1F0_9PEZI